MSDTTSTQGNTPMKTATGHADASLAAQAGPLETQCTGPDGHVWTINRNNLLSRRQLVFAYGLLLGGTLALAIQWAAAGAWFVMPYVVMEVVVCAWMTIRHLRHAHDYDRIELSDGCLVVTKRRGSVTTRQVLNALWARIQLEDTAYTKLEIRYGGHAIHLGEHASVEHRRCVAAEIREQLNELTYGRR